MIKLLTVYLIDLMVAITLTMISLIIFIMGCLSFPFKKTRGFWIHQLNRIENVMKVFYEEEIDD